MQFRICRRPADVAGGKESCYCSNTAARRVRRAEATFWLEWAAPMAVKPGDKGRNAAEQCGSSGLAASITIKAKQHTLLNLLPPQTPLPHLSWWNSVDAVETSQIPQRGQPPLVTRSQHQNLIEPHHQLNPIMWIVPKTQVIQTQRGHPTPRGIQGIFLD